MADKITLGFYPYTYVRTTVMKSFLLKKDDYHKLMKMKIDEITSHLQNLSYKKEINELGVNYQGLELIDRALSKNMDQCFQKLYKIADPNLRLVIESYLKRFDIWNIKTILRGIQAGMDPKQMHDMLSFAGTMKLDFYDNLIKKESVDAVIKVLEKTEYRSITKLGSDTNLIKIENHLDKIYYESVIALSKRISSAGDNFRKFIETEVETINIMTILRLKREKFSEQKIQEFLILPKDYQLKLTKKLLHARDIEHTLSHLKRSSYGKHIKSGIAEFESTKSLTEIERLLKKYQMEQAFLLTHKYVLSVSIILSYLFLKETEVKNLRTIIKGKSLGIDNDFIEKELVV